jgi:2-amino-4-hydroxy-6-hydroxymethyldihydropteridine diphosphokinase
MWNTTVILVALGANLPTRHGPPAATLAAALAALEAEGVRILARSRWYRSAAVPASDQPDFVNGVASVGTARAPADLLATLHRVEAAFGRARTVANAARPLDLDLIDYDGRIADGRDGGPVLPHPRAHRRAFVLLPLAEIAPGWIHPVLGRPVDARIAALAPQDCRPIE